MRLPWREYGDMMPNPQSRCYRLSMARLARIVIPGFAHHVTQPGNRREAIFFEDGDQEIYLDLLAEQTLKADVAVWAYCLINREFPRLCRGGSQTLRIPGAFPVLLLWLCRSSLSNELLAVAVAFAFQRLR